LNANIEKVDLIPEIKPFHNEIIILISGIFNDVDEFVKNQVGLLIHV
jgi:hypothetical protein